MTIPGKKVATLEVPLRWGDMDAYGHANNTVYFRFYEEARIAWLTSLQLGGPEEPTGPVIIKTSATFLKELYHPATLLVETYVDKAGNTSLDTYYLLRDANSGDVYSEGYAKIVWFDRKTRTSAPLPDTLRALAAS
ncbi:MULTISPECIES: acyl-CoA thioesterase [Marinobacter]|uniref:Thioesterase family protein n=1 Tax=Marinobacter suaedae TaxID=3057675 RepID=A0ABT8W2A4_9GAMM|nr:MULTISPECIES: thioesterase family protein [unclassified Marinobacter]MBZ2167905.1 acyl-CoA thioesterase [Marinobacter sp. F4216]MDO3722364.1 thioesterase family protein [Marinobacter sp. chi1]